MDAEPELEGTDSEGASENAVHPLEILKFVLGAARRHVPACVIVALSVAVLGLTLAQVLPQSYDATSRIYIDETVSRTETLSSPDRALPNLDLVGGAFELLLQKSSLASITEEAGLVASWEAHRPAPLRWKDRVMAWLGGGGPTAAEKNEALVKMLQGGRLWVTRDKNVVAIKAIWNDPAVTFRLTKIVQNRLIALLRSRQSAAFTEAISILEAEAQRARAAIEPALAELVRVREREKQTENSSEVAATPTTAVAARNPGVAAGSGSTPTNAARSPERVAQQLSAKLNEVSQRIQAVEEPWRRHQFELKARMAELGAVYGKEHPQVVQQEAQIKAASEPPAELIELRRARAALLDEVQSASSETADEATPSQRGPSRGVVFSRPAGRPIGRASGLAPNATPEESPAAIAAKAVLTRALDEYDVLSSRLHSAQLQFTTAQVASNTKFVVTGEPEMPNKPTKPLRMIVTMASIAAGLLLGLFAGAARDLLSGKIYEPWQLRRLGLKPLGELRLPTRAG